jgi:hypothetical protein
MPSILANLWACNRWDTDADLQTASDRAALGVNWQAEVDALEGDEYNSSPQGLQYDAAAWYRDLTEEWPDVPSLIGPEEFIGPGNSDAYRHWNEHWRDTTSHKPDTIQCFDYARYQLLVAGHDTTDYKPDSTTYQAYTTAGGLDMNETAEGVRYLKRTLARGVPVLVGILLATYDAPPELRNKDKTTNHYVVIVGMGMDAEGPLFLFLDRLLGSTPEAFYFRPNLKLEHEGEKRLVTHIRETR